MIYDGAFPEPVGNSRSSALLSFKDGLIISLELVYDSRPLMEHAELIFGSKRP